jgi:glycosidase
LPSMLDGDQDRIRCVYSMLFSLPGTPVLFYGEEIGMAENLDVKGRLAVRTPMQWEPGPGGGFSPADSSQLPAPLVSGEFGPDRVNVVTQRRDPNSLLRWMGTMIRRRRECPEFGWGQYTVLDVDVSSVLAHLARWDGSAVLAVHNLAEQPVQVRLTLSNFPAGTRLVDLLREETIELYSDGEVTVDLGRYGYRWLRVLSPGERVLV